MYLLTAVVLGWLLVVPQAQGVYLLEIDTDGLDDGTVTYHPNFSFGGDTTTASQSAASTAFGMTGGDSIFGGDGGLLPDTYIYSYTPSTTTGDVDNLAVAPGTNLGGGNVATGMAGGVSGFYSIYATWPMTSNVSGEPVTFSMAHDGGLLVAPIAQNGFGHEWMLIGQVDLTADTTYQLSQESSLNSFVSMRSAGVMFELIEARPTEPPSVPEGGASILLMAIALCPLLALRVWKSKDAPGAH